MGDEKQPNIGRNIHITNYQTEGVDNAIINNGPRAKFIIGSLKTDAATPITNNAEDSHFHIKDMEHKRRPDDKKPK